MKEGDSKPSVDWGGILPSWTNRVVAGDKEHQKVHVGYYHTRKITLPVIPLTVLVTLPIRVMEWV